MEGQIIKINSSIYTVDINNEQVECTCRGVMRHNKVTPLVGDYVKISNTQIMEVLPRRNEFYRPKVANIDQAVLVTSLKDPKLDINLLDKLITLLELKKVDIIIYLTKVDLVSSIDEVLTYYKNIGYKVLKDVDNLKPLLKNKTTVFVGQTGAGKSTLINKLDNNLDLKTGEISKALGRGKHTTRVTELFNICEGKVLDTPGFSSLDLKGTKEEVEKAFIEFDNYVCPYKDCSHTNEKECLVKEAVENKEILKSRYNNYLRYREEISS